MDSPYLAVTNDFVSSYVLGPFFAFLPARLRAKWFGNRRISWRGATIISGFIQFFLGPFVLLICVGIVQRGVIGGLAEILSWRRGSEITGEQFTLFSLWISAFHPLVWCGFYWMFEGPVRSIAAAYLGENYGTLPLFLIDQAYLFTQRKILKNGPTIVPDQVSNTVSNDGWRLRIESCRPKRGWDVGRLLCYREQFYRIEACTVVSGPRPYVFVLHSVAAGVKSDRVILYSAGAPRSEALL